MKRYRWPGNIRELENFIRRVAILHPQSMITEQLVERELQYELDGAVVRSPAGEEPPFAGEVMPVLRKLFEDCGDRLPRPGLYHRVVREIEAPLIIAALAATRGHQIKAAELLGLNRNTLRKKMIGLDVHPRFSRLLERYSIRSDNALAFLRFRVNSQSDRTISSRSESTSRACGPA